MPEQEYLIDLYTEGSEFVVSPDYKGAERPVQDEIKTHIDSLLGYCHKKVDEINYLELGVGPGYFFEYFYRNSKNAYGIEPGSWKPSNPNIVRDISSIPKNIKFDLIIIQHVLEHIENPLKTLSEMKDLASDTCIINCNFPNKDCIYALFLRGRWRMIRPIGHLNYFSRTSVDELFKRSGWKIIEKYNYRSESSLTASVKKFNWNIRNPLKLSYRVFKDLIFKEILFEKDQWHVIGAASNSL